MTSATKKYLGQYFIRLYYRLIGRFPRGIGYFVLVIMYIITMIAFLVILINGMDSKPWNQISRSISTEIKLTPPHPAVSNIIILSDTSSEETAISRSLKTNTLIPINLAKSLIKVFQRFLDKCFLTAQQLYTSTIGKLIERFQVKDEKISQKLPNQIKISFPISYAAKIARRDDSYDTSLTTKQLQLIEESYLSPILHSKDIENLAKTTKFPLTRYSIFQYYEATDWIGNYHGLP